MFVFIDSIIEYVFIGFVFVKEWFVFVFVFYKFWNFVGNFYINDKFIGVVVG